MNIITMLASTVYCYVGCNTGSPDQQALHVLACDTESGETRLVQSVTGLQGTTYFQFDEKNEYLYTVIAENREGKPLSAAVRFKMDGWKIGPIERLAGLPCEAPCHVSLSPDGKRLNMAAYSSATVCTLSLAEMTLKTLVLPNEGMGPVKNRQQKAYAHFAFTTPDGGKLGIIDLGCDRIHFFDPETLAEDKAMTILTDPGDGPRHAVWSKDNRFLFVVNELGNSVYSFAFDGKSFARVGKWTMIPDGFAGDTKASAIKLTKDGKVLLASNRGHDSIAIFSVDTEKGLLELRNIAKLTGVFPRDFELMPGERFAVVGHKRSDEVAIYGFDAEHFALSPVGDVIKIWKPLCFKFREK